MGRPGGYTPGRVVSDLEQALRDLPRHGRLVSRGGGLAVWQFEHAGRDYRLYHFGRFTRRRAGWRMFKGLQELQKAKVPALRAVAMLSGFRIDDGQSSIGDAVIVEFPAATVGLDQYLQELWTRGADVPDRRQLALQLREVLVGAGNAGLGLRELTLGSFVLSAGRVLIGDGSIVRRGGLRQDDLLSLAHSARRFATRLELLRAWSELCPGAMPPRWNKVAAARDAAASRMALGENARFGKVAAGGWRGFYVKRADYPRRWAPASAATVIAADWERIWPDLLAQMQAGRLEPLKRDDNGDVWAGDVTLGGQTVRVVIKHPRRKKLRQYLTDALRGSRARRSWIKTHKALARDLPAEWPLLLMEKRRLGYVTDAVAVFGYVAGPTLATVDLDDMPYDARDRLMRRAGTILRRIEALGFTHTDAKSTNWIVYDDPWLGATPIMIDVDGLRHYRWPLMGLHRLLRAMRQHPQYTPQDSKALCQGYAPLARLRVEPEATDARDAEAPIAPPAV